MSDSAADQGERQARRLFGDARFEQTRRPDDPSHRRQLLAMADEMVFGTVYARPGLTLHQRSLCTVAALTVLGRENQLRAHVSGALHIGISEQEIVEVVTQMAMYGGFPAALNAMQVVDECINARRVASPDGASNG